jgi:hypothetical protein
MLIGEVGMTGQGLRKRLEIPRSLPGLVTKRLLVMNFIEGDQITRLAHRTQGLSQRCALLSTRTASQRPCKKNKTRLLIVAPCAAG